MWPPMPIMAEETLETGHCAGQDDFEITVTSAPVSINPDNSIVCLESPHSNLQVKSVLHWKPFEAKISGGSLSSQNPGLLAVR